MVAFLLPAFAVIYSIFQQTSTKQTAKKALLGIVLLICAAASRHNAIAAEPTLICLLIIGLYKAYVPTTKMILLKSLLFAIPVTGFIFAVYLGINRSLATTHVQAAQFLELFDLSGMVRFNHNQQIIDSKIAQDLQPLLNQNNFNSENIYKYYDPTDWQTLTQANLYRFPSGRREVSHLHHAWFISILHHPHAYLTHRFEVYRHMIGLGNTIASVEIYDVIQSADTMQDPHFPRMYEPAKITYTPSWLQLKISQYLGELARDSYTRYFFKPWIYMLAGFLLLGYLGIKRNSSHFPAAMLIISGLTYNFAYFFIAPSSDFRYSNWTVISVIIAILLILMQDKQSIDKHNSPC